jgi:hypothetical protein
MIGKSAYEQAAVTDYRLSWVIYATFSLVFFYSNADLVLLWAENVYTTWRRRGALKVFLNMHNKNIYKENWKVPAAQQQFSVRGGGGGLSVTARRRARAV